MRQVTSAMVNLGRVPNVTSTDKNVLFAAKYVTSIANKVTQKDKMIRSY